MCRLFGFKCALFSWRHASHSALKSWSFLIQSSIAPVTLHCHSMGTKGMMLGVSSSAGRSSSHVVKSIPLALAKSLRCAWSSKLTLGKGEIGENGGWLLWIDVCSAMRGAALIGDGDQAHFPNRLSRQGRIAAMRIDAAVLVLLKMFPDSVWPLKCMRTVPDPCMKNTGCKWRNMNLGSSGNHHPKPPSTGMSWT